MQNLYKRMNQAEQAWLADCSCSVKLAKLEKAERAYYAALKTARTKWEAITESDAKDAAEENANDTPGTNSDELYWFNIALGTYNLRDAF